MDRNELVAEMRAGRQRLDAALGRVSDEQMARPVLGNSWSVKDLVAHLGFWEWRIVNLYGHLSRGEAVPEDNLTMDELNEQAFILNQDFPLVVVKGEERNAYNQLLVVAEKAAEADLFDPHRFPWTEGEPFVNFIKDNTYVHYDEHLGDLLAWLDK